MKHLLKTFSLAVLAIGCSLTQVLAQQLPPLPADPAVRIGKLDNGLTYYIRHNELPADRADFYITSPVTPFATTWRPSA